jgi:hypothetical protein
MNLAAAFIAQCEAAGASTMREIFAVAVRLGRYRISSIEGEPVLKFSDGSAARIGKPD